VWYRLIEVLADAYGWTFDYCLHRLSFAQAITILDARHERLRRANEAAEQRQRESQLDGWEDPAKYAVDEDDVESLPTRDDIRATLAGLFG